VTIQRAIEILEPTSLAEHTPDEWVTAHRMACQALALLRWKNAGEELPGSDDGLVLVVCRADLSNHCKLLDAIQLAEYYEEDDAWELEGWPEAENVAVSHWMRLPELPEGVEE
jgi:hypothetical protein